MRCEDIPGGDMLLLPFCTKGNRARAPSPRRFPAKIARRGCDDDEEEEDE